MKNILLFSALCSSLILVGCNSSPQSSTLWSPENTPQVVKIGVIAPLSWPAASIGEDTVNTYTFAMQEFNNAQDDYKVELIIEDGKCNGKDASSAAQKLVHIDKVKIILWGVCSSETLAIAKITAPASVVLISAVSSSPEISKEENYVYRYYNDLYQVATLKAYFDKYSIKKIALIYENNDYWIWFARALENSIWGKNILVSEKFTSEEKDFSLMAKKVTNVKNNIDAIVYIPSSDSSTINIMKALDSEKLVTWFKDKIFTTEVGYSVNALKELGALMEWVLTTQLPDAKDLWSKADIFINMLKKQYTPNFAETFIVLYKESFDMLAAGLTDPAYGENNINAYIQTITEKNPRDGLFGSYYFNGVDVERVNFVVKKIVEGKLVTAE